jgi:hypothetical protein
LLEQQKAADSDKRQHAADYCKTLHECVLSLEAQMM